ncbi:MAG: hypothetical protein PVF27_05920 [Gemmatimonadales bacterium]
MVRTENFRRGPMPTAAHLATVNEGVQLLGDSVADGWVRVALEGWVWARSVAGTTRDGHDLVVSRAAGENLRAEPNGEIVARLENGCLLDELDRRPGWIHARRVGWMFAQSLERVDLAQEPDTAAPAPEAETDRPPASYDTVTVGLDRAVAAAGAVLRATPDGDTSGTLVEDAPVRILARSEGWVRVTAEGWVRADELKPTTPNVLTGVSGAEVRASPSEYRGRLVRWLVRFIAVQRADELRPEIPRGERYVLVRGPLPETGFIYVVVSDEQLARFERMPPLTELEILGRIRVGRSQYLGNPIVTLVDVAERGS